MNDRNDTRWCSLYDEYFRQMKLVRQANHEITADITFQQESELLYREINEFNLFSPAYFKISLKGLRARLKNKDFNGFTITQESIDPDQWVMTPEATWHRAINEENLSPEQVDPLAKQLAVRTATWGMEDQRIKKDFQDFINYLVQQKHEVQILLVPVHPLVYQSAKTALMKMEKEVRQMAYNDGIKVMGSYDPSTFALTDADFLDGTHPKVYIYSKLLGE